MSIKSLAHALGKQDRTKGEYRLPGYGCSRELIQDYYEGWCEGEQGTGPFVVMIYREGPLKPQLYGSFASRQTAREWAQAYVPLELANSTGFDIYEIKAHET